MHFFLFLTCYQYFCYLISCLSFLYQSETCTISFINIFINRLWTFQVKNKSQETVAPFMMYAPMLMRGGIINAPYKQYNRPYGVWGIINAPQKHCNRSYDAILIKWSTGALFQIWRTDLKKILFWNFFLKYLRGALYYTAHCASTV